MTEPSTMNCETARLQIGADPAEATTALDAHVAGCADCSVYRREMRALEGDLRLAMAWPEGAAIPARTDGETAPGGSPGGPLTRIGNVVPLRPANEAARGMAGAGGAVGTGGSAGTGGAVGAGATGAAGGGHADLHAAPLPTARRWALAAGVLLAGVLATSFFALQPRDALATAIVAHMSKEPDAWGKTQPIPRSALELVLARAGVRLDQVESGNVVYANSCFLRGRYMPHLVVSTPTGPVTVIVLRGEAVPQRVEFEEGRYSGVLLPVPGGGGGIAVLARGGSGAGGAGGAQVKPDVEAAAAGVLAALKFEGEAPPPMQ